MTVLKYKQLVIEANILKVSAMSLAQQSEHKNQAGPCNDF